MHVTRRPVVSEKRWWLVQSTVQYVLKGMDYMDYQPGAQTVQTCVYIFLSGRPTSSAPCLSECSPAPLPAYCHADERAPNGSAAHDYAGRRP